MVGLLQLSYDCLTIIVRSSGTVNSPAHKPNGLSCLPLDEMGITSAAYLLEQSHNIKIPQCRL